MVAWGNLFGIRVKVLMRTPHFSEAQQNWEQHSQLRERKKEILSTYWSQEAYGAILVHGCIASSQVSIWDWKTVNLKGSLNPHICAGSPRIWDYYESWLIRTLLQQGAESLQLHLELRGPVCLAPWRIKLLNVPTAEDWFDKGSDVWPLNCLQIWPICP